MMTYISLFSGAGVGCYGFKQEGFACVATNELVERRLEVQRFNGKCKYDTGYICGDITDSETKARLFSQVDLWKEKEKLRRVDVVIATPPCQGMSVANHKKTDREILRNSLVVESIKIIAELNPRFFVFENVPAFMKTLCTDTDGVDKPIAQAIRSGLGHKYSYTSRVINFKDYGACSSRQRTLVLGVANDYANEVSPFELYPALVKERTLREVVGHMRPLTELGEIDPEDIYHAFRAYPAHMRDWISGLREGESAFENQDDRKKPHQIKNGCLVVNTQKNGDKYRRQYWDKVGPCIHTRNDQLASQNTIHPRDDRVFSVRELMLMMTVPESFNWTGRPLPQLNQMPQAEKAAFLKKEEFKIRQSLGEAVPTAVFQAVAKKIKAVLQRPPLSTAEINKIVSAHRFEDPAQLLGFVESNPMGLSPSALSRIAELSNTKRTDQGAFFTSKPLITEMMNALPELDGGRVRILEPAVGVGNFVPLLLKKYEGKEICLDLMDVDETSLAILKALLRYYEVPGNVHIRYITGDFLTYPFSQGYDLVVGNPPFYKMKAADKRLAVYRKKAINQDTTNICSFFLEKSLAIGKYVALVFPKFLLSTPEFSATRAYLYPKSVACILDFGEKGFPGVLIETIAIFINNRARPSYTRVFSATEQVELCQKQKYIFDKSLPYWVLYRDAAFDRVLAKLQLDVFKVFRDRQVTNGMLHGTGAIRVLKSRNIADDGQSVLDIKGYDAYISGEEARGLSVYRFLNQEGVYLTPNMTYNPRAIPKPAGTLVNGSVAVLIPKPGVAVDQEQLRYFSTEEYRRFYRVARNHQTRSLNVDACSVFFYGLLKKNGGEGP